MENLSEKGFVVADWQVSPAEGLLSHADEVVHLEPKVMEVLVYFASRPGEVITRDELERDVWHGALVGYDAVTATVIKLRKALQDNAKQPRIIATIPKKGYQLITPISHAENNIGRTATDNNTTPAQQTSSHMFTWVGVIGALLVVGLVVASLWLLQPQSQNMVVPSIAVLPFKNLSEDPKQEYFSDGITDDLITDLSKVSSMRVIARQSAYHYKNNTAGLEEIARELDVLYIIEGSVQQSGKHIRVNVQLTNTEKGESIWAERFNTDTNNIFEVQDKIIQRVVEAMYVTLSSKETEHIASRTTKNFDAYNAFLAGQQHMRRRTKQDYDLALEAYQHAIQIDPNYARAYGAMAVALTLGYRFQWTELSLVEARERALELAKNAVALDQSTPQIYWALSYVHVHRREFGDAEVAVKQSIALSPNYADGYALLAYIANWRGKFSDAVTYIKKATTLNPYHTFDYPWNLGLAYYNLGRYDEAITTLHDALERNESALNPRLFLAAAYTRLDRMEDAAWEIEQINVMRPNTTLSRLSIIMPFEHNHHLLSFLEDLRKAGLPE